MLRIALVLLVGCADPEMGSVDFADAPTGGTESQIAPQGHTALTAWLAAGHYLSWACEDAPHPARPPGAHGMNRICSNAALSGSSSGPFPVGAVSVKELHRNGSIIGYAVARKLSSGSGGSSWYWYEGLGSSVVADGVGVGLCTGCHDDATRDYTFTRVE
jgi:hypothetical protein